MDSYDSDSSGIEDEELGDYTDTGVLLGYAAEEVIEDSISHLGGWPEWLDPSTPPPGHFAKCKVCNSPMPLLLQLDAGIPKHFPYDERRLYIFGCTKRPCNRKPGNIRALRGVIKSKIVDAQQEHEKNGALETKTDEPQQVPKHDIGADLFGVSSPSAASSGGNPNPFSTKPSPQSSTPANPFASIPPTSSLAAIPPQKPAEEQKSKTETETETETDTTLSASFADKVRLSSSPPAKKQPTTATPPEPWPPQSSFQTPYTLYHLDAEYETLSQPSTPTIPQSVQIEPLENEPSSSSSSAGKNADAERDSFESALDKSFLRFSTRLEHNPEQVLRYEFQGTPLLYSTTDEVGRMFAGEGLSGGGGGGGGRIPRCEACGAKRAFELQLVPHAIAVLEEGREGIGLGPKDDPGMEWGTLIVGVCSVNCGADQVGVADWREEWVGVQWEERIA